MEFLLNVLNELVTKIEKQEEINSYKNAMLVEIDDNLGAYLSTLKTKLIANSATINFNNLIKLKKGDFIIISDKGINLLTNEELSKLPKTITKYSLVNDFRKIINFIEQRATVRSSNPCDTCPFKNSCQQSETPVRLYEDKDIQIFNNFVRVGYGQYPIRSINGVKFIVSDSKDLFLLKEESYYGGRKYLELKK